MNGAVCIMRRMICIFQQASYPSFVASCSYIFIHSFVCFNIMERLHYQTLIIWKDFYHLTFICMIWIYQHLMGLKCFRISINCLHQMGLKWWSEILYHVLYKLIKCCSIVKYWIFGREDWMLLVNIENVDEFFLRLKITLLNIFLSLFDTCVFNLIWIGNDNFESRVQTMNFCIIHSYAAFWNAYSWCSLSFKPVEIQNFCKTQFFRIQSSPCEKSISNNKIYRINLWFQPPRNWSASNFTWK